MANEASARRANGQLVRAAITWRGPLFDFIFKPAQRNRAYKSAMIFGAGYWIAEFMPRRFDDAYAKLLGYQIGPGWTKAKSRILKFLRPFYGLTGDANNRGYTKMIRSVNAARPVAASSSTKGQRLAIRIPFGHPLNPFHARVFTRIPYWEEERVAEKAAVALDYMLQNPTSVKGYKPPKQRKAPSTRQRK
jgi:hypothetical protein